MADIKTAEQISKKVRALKYFQGVVRTADRKGVAVIKLNCTGAEFSFNKDDVLYLKVQTMIAKLSEEIASLEIVQRSEAMEVRSTQRRRLPAPVGAAPVSNTNYDDIRRAKQREYTYRYREKLKKLGIKRMSDLPQ